MFYYINKSTSNSHKKKTINPYRQIIKQLIDDINKTDINAAIAVNTLNPEYRNINIEEYISWVHSQGKDISYSMAEKKLKNIYEETGLDRTIIFYIAVLNTSLAEDFILKISRMNNVKDADFFNNYEEFKIRKFARTTLTKISLYSIIFSENLLEKSIFKFSINEDYSKTRIIKEIRSEKMSLFKGLDDIPLLLTQKETDLACNLINKLKRDSQNIAIFEHLKLLLSQNTLEHFNALYCFENKFDDYVKDSKFNINDAKKFEAAKFYPVPVEATYQRKIIPPEEGVVLRVIDHPNIESLYINECSRFNYRIIYGVTRFKDGYEQSFSLKIDINPVVILYTLYSSDLVGIILDFYKVPSSFKETLGITTSFKFELLPADAWKFRKKDYTVTYTNENTIATPKFNTYVRKTKGKPSKETLIYAEKLKLTLEENQTLVKEKDRRYNILNI